jgi:HAD superfamily hydrolase (TIGR01509 family)
VIFDADGVLVAPTDPDTSRLAIEKAFRAFGVSRPRREHVDALLGVTPEELARVCAAYDIDAETFWPERDRRLERAQRRALHRGKKPLYNDVATLRSLRTDRDLAIVSNNQHETIGYVLDFFGIDGLFETFYGREPTVEGLRVKKPDPHYLRRALSDLGARDEQALFVGDSNVDIEAAREAGIDSAFLRRPRRAEYALDSQPTHEIMSLTEVSDLRPGTE